MCLVVQYSRVISVQHHGRSTCSIAELLDAIYLEISSVQVGYRNCYRQPKLNVMAAYETRRIKYYRTDTDDMEQFDLTSLEVSANCRIHARYWLDLPNIAAIQDKQ